ncbi:MAG TPA: 16S rRNA (guanine(966)-N(2))-methyltransferase RsmD [Micropepsaceae bacterium]|nr:16S rRNA (guanine(966)-N(2))-methyltransferase RsmD [Micropepsaceae bacterium]
MRIVGGQWRGRALEGPDDMRVRPTSDRVREALFNILAHHDFGAFALDGARVIDLFAGTGALALEALSRGARFALLVDDSAESRAIIRRNVDALMATGVTKIWRRDATALGPIPGNAGGAFDLAFLDPPYRKGLLLPALASLREGGWLLPHAVIVCEMAADEVFSGADGFVIADERSWGETKAVFLRLG